MSQVDFYVIHFSLTRAEEFCSDVIHTAEAVEVAHANQIISRMSKRLG